MARSRDKKLLQLQVEGQLKTSLEELAKVDHRSLAQECLWLLEQGIRKRGELKQLEEAAERGWLMRPGQGEDEENTQEGVRPTGKAAGEGALQAAERRAPTLSSGSRRPTPEFRQAAILAWVVRELHTEGRPVSRFRAGKMIYLIERAERLGLFQHYLKQVAGPYDPNLRYGGPERIAMKDHRWLSATDDSHFEPGPNIEEAGRYAERWLPAERARKVVADFQKYTNGALERWTTVDMAAREIAANGGAVTVEVVLDHIQAIREWAPKLKREEFEPQKVASTLAGLRKRGFLDDENAGQ